jgi:hypothetical protein
MELVSLSSVSLFLFTHSSIVRVQISNLSAPRFDRNIIQNLVVDKGRLNTVKSLAESFARLDRLGKPLIEKPRDAMERGLHRRKGQWSSIPFAWGPWCGANIYSRYGNAHQRPHRVEY